MNHSYARPILVAGALSLLGMPGGGSVHEMSIVHAAPWIAPAPQQELSAKWVQDVAREFRKPKIRNIFMNIPGGSPQATILDLLNEAGKGLENGEPEYARHLVRKAVNVLDRSAGRGWYTESDIQPIQAMILKYAKQGFSGADHKWKSRNRNNSGNRQISSSPSSRSQDDGVRLFNPGEPNFYGHRWEGYTRDHWQGSEESYDRMKKQNIRHNQENFVPSRNRASKRSFWEDRGRRSESSRRDRDSYRDRMPWSMKQDRRLHDRGSGQDEYFESTTRTQSRGFNR